MKRRLVVGHDLHRLILPQQDVSRCSVEEGSIFLIGPLQAELPHIGSTLHQGVNVGTAGCDGQKADSCQYGETSADIIRYHELLVTLLIGQLLQCTLRLVSCRVDSLGCTFLAVLLLQQLLEYTERDGRLCGGTGLGNDVHREVLALQYLGQVMDVL